MELQERYADDPQRFNEEMQKFYSENKFNPLEAACPPSSRCPSSLHCSRSCAIRFPRAPTSWHFRVARRHHQRRGDAARLPGRLGLRLSVLSLACWTLVPMLLNTQPDSPQASQTKIMGVVMALMMIWFGWNVPVGVVLYYVTSFCLGCSCSRFSSPARSWRRRRPTRLSAWPTSPSRLTSCASSTSRVPTRRASGSADTT